MERRSKRNPPPRYTRPDDRKFYVWQDRTIRYPAGHHAWRWLCTMCDPPASGFRSTPDAWVKILTVSLPHHLRSRRHHRQHMQRHHRVTV